MGKKKTLSAWTVLVAACSLTLAPTMADAQTKSSTSISIRTPTKSDFEENNQFLLFSNQMATGLTGARQFVPSRAVFQDGMNLSRLGFLMFVYDLVEDGNKMITTPPQADSSQIGMDFVPGGNEEIEARLKRLIELKIVTEKEAKEGVTTKEFIANVLYRVYKNIVPYKGSIEFTDTKNPAVNWAGEVGLPFFLSKHKTPVYPNQEMIMPDQYYPVIYYAYMYLPRKKVGNQYQYNALDYSKKPDSNLSLLLMYFKGKPLLGNEALYQLQKEYDKALPGVEKKIMEVLPKYVTEIRQEVLKPRLAEWKRDVLENPSLKNLVASYQKTKSVKTASAILTELKKQYNLYAYQETVPYVTYMFKVKK